MKRNRLQFVAGALAVAMLAPAFALLHAMTGRGGILAGVVGLLFLASAGVLGVTASGGFPTDYRYRLCLLGLTLSATVVIVASAAMLAASRIYPESNLLGGWALLFGPMLWGGSLGLLILLIPSVYVLSRRG